METIKVKVVLPGGEVKTGKIDLSYSPEKIEDAILECFGLDKKSL